MGYHGIGGIARLAYARALEADLEVEPLGRPLVGADQKTELSIPVVNKSSFQHRCEALTMNFGFRLLREFDLRDRTSLRTIVIRDSGGI